MEAHAQASGLVRRVWIQLGTQLAGGFRVLPSGGRNISGPWRFPLRCGATDRVAARRFGPRTEATIVIVMEGSK